MKPPIIVTKRFVLRPYRMSDTEVLARNINDPVIGRNTSVSYPYRLKDAKTWIQKTRRMARNSESDAIHFAVDIGGEVIGGIGLHHIKPKHKAEIGYWLTGRFRGRGIMPRAVRKVTEFGFRRLRLRRIYAFTFTFNTASARVLKKCGFRHEGTLKKHLKRGGRYFDHHLFAQVR